MDLLRSSTGSLDNRVSSGYDAVSVMESQPTLFTEDQLRGPTGRSEVERLCTKAHLCKGCRLHETRTNVVFGSGNPSKPRVAFVGEAPGKNEDEHGQPFIGRAGKLLDGMIEAMGLSRDSIYICNVVCCRPPENRKPFPDEVMACREFLHGQLRAVTPSAIVALGAVATGALLNTKKRIEEMRGKWHDWEGIPLRATFHPAYLLRDPSQKKEAWADLQEVMAKVGIVK